MGVKPYLVYPIFLFQPHYFTNNLMEEFYPFPNSSIKLLVKNRLKMNKIPLFSKHIQKRPINTIRAI